MFRTLVAVIIIAFFLGCGSPTVLFIQDPYNNSIHQDWQDVYLNASWQNGFIPQVLVLNPQVTPDDFMSQVSSLEWDHLILSSLYSGDALERIRIDYPEILVVLMEGANSFADERTSVISTDRVPAFSRLGEISAQWYSQLEPRGWGTPGMLIYSRSANRSEEKRALQTSWGNAYPSAFFRSQEFFNFRNQRDFTRILELLLDEPALPWLYLFSSAMNHEAFGQLPSELLLVGEGIKKLPGMDLRALASIEKDLEALYTAALKSFALDTQSYQEVPASLWINPQADVLLDQLGDRTPLDSDSQDSESSENTQDEDLVNPTSMEDEGLINDSSSSTSSGSINIPSQVENRNSIESGPPSPVPPEN